MNAKIGTARTHAANRRWSCATDQMATRLPKMGNVRHSTSTYGFARALVSSAVFSVARPSARGVVSTAAAGARYGSLYSWCTSLDAIHTAPTNIMMPTTGPSRISILRFIAPFITPLVTVPASLGVRRRLSGGGRVRRSCSGGGRACGTRQPLVLEVSYIGDDRPPVARGDRPAVRGHQRQPVRHDVEEITVRGFHQPVLVEGGGGDVASLEQDAFAVAPRVVARLAIDPVPLAAAGEQRLVHRYRDRRDELPVRSLAREEGVLFQPADRDRSRDGLAHRRAVVEEGAGRLGKRLRLVEHARIGMDRRPARRAAACAAREGDHARERDGAGHPSGHDRTPSRSGFGFRTLAR